MQELMERIVKGTDNGYPNRYFTKLVADDG